MRAIALSLALSTAIIAGTARAELIAGVTVSNRLVTFNSSAPGTLLSNIAITGVQPGDRILGIDFRPSQSEVIAVGESNFLYRLNTSTGVATPIGSGFNPPLDGSPFTRYGIDINPTVDRVRVVGSGAQNRRLNPNDGTAVVTSGNPLDTNLSYNPPSTSLIPPRAVAVAYTNSVAGALPGSTREYILDSFAGILAEVGSQAGGNPSFNAGVSTAVGPLGITINDNAGFDISGASGVAFASLNIRDSLLQTGLYTINLSTGAATSIGTIGGTDSIRDITVIPTPGTLALLGATLGFAARRRRM